MSNYDKHGGHNIKLMDDNYISLTSDDKSMINMIKIIKSS